MCVNLPTRFPAVWPRNRRESEHNKRDGRSNIAGIARQVLSEKSGLPAPFRTSAWLMFSARLTFRIVLTLTAGMPEPLMANDHSFRQLLPTFVISAGTQVVLKVAKALADGETIQAGGKRGHRSAKSAGQPTALSRAICRRRDRRGVLRRTGVAAARSRGRIGPDHRGYAALDHLSLPGRLEGVWVGQRRFRRRFARHLPAAGPAALVAAAAARTIGV